MISAFVQFSTIPFQYSTQSNKTTTADVLGESITRSKRTSCKKPCQTGLGWMDVSSDDDKTHAMIFDVQIVENEYYDENVANGNNGVNVIDANVDDDANEEDRFDDDRTSGSY